MLFHSDCDRKSLASAGSRTYSAHDSNTVYIPPESIFNKRASQDWERAFSSLPDNLRHINFLIQEVFVALANDWISVIFNPPSSMSVFDHFLSSFPQK